MTVHDTYGSSVHTAAELPGIVAERLGLTFAERESDYLGVYYHADAAPYLIEVQPNAIPATTISTTSTNPNTRRATRSYS